jgi:hypothetical protein
MSGATDEQLRDAIAKWKLEIADRQQKIDSYQKSHPDFVMDPTAKNENQEAA